MLCKLSSFRQSESFHGCELVLAFKEQEKRWRTIPEAFCRTDDTTLLSPVLDFTLLFKSSFSAGDLSLNQLQMDGLVV